MGNHTVLTNDKEQPRPCDGCPQERRCATLLLACRSYVHWVSYGRYKEPTAPLREYYLAVASDALAGSSAHYNRARSEEHKLKVKACAS